MNNVKCLVTGASGFIGRELCRSLREAGCDVLPLSRSGAPLPDGTSTRAVDLAAETLDEALFTGVDVVVHLAGIAHQQAQDSAYQSLNVAGTQNLARAAARAGVPTFIFASSVKAMGPAPGPQARAEDDCLPPTDPYGRSKREAELALVAMQQQFQSLLILRPALVYGREPKGNIALLSRAVSWGLPRPPRRGARSMVALDDLVDLIRLLVLAPPAGLHTWIACAAQSHSTRDIYDQLRLARGKDTGMAWLPGSAWRAAARVLDLLSRQPAGTMFQKMFGDETYDSARARDELQWRADTDLASVIAQMQTAPRGER